MKQRKGRFSRHQKSVSQDPRIVFLRNFFLVCGLLLVAKLFWFQGIQGAIYAALASDQHEIYKTLFPERGTIYLKDKNSLSHEEQLYPVATNKEYKTLYAQPKFITNPQATAQALAPILNISEEDLLVKLDKPNDPYEVLKRKLTDEEYAQLSGQVLEGIKFQNEEYRFYPEGDIGAHVLGFVGNVQEQRVGQYGIEGYFEEELRGAQGEVKSEKDLAGRWIASTAKSFSPAVDGADIVLTLDKNIQFQVCRILKEEAERYEAESGAVIVMHPFTGEIMAMCSYPSFNPNEYNLVESVDVYNNTGVFEAYEPGSIFKPITMAAALDTGVVSPSTTFVDNGEVKIDVYTIRNADKAAHGKVDMVEVLNQSLNTGMIFVVERLGITNFKRYVENFGFGEKTGIQLNVEGVGNINSLSKKGDIYAFTASFGQGITATPLQMVQAFAAIANGGFMVRPYIVDEIREEGEVVVTEPKVLAKILDQKTSTLLGGMLVSVVRNGQANRAQVPGYTIAGKTGTAQIPDFERGGYSNRTNHSFVGYGPVDNPAFVMIVKLENPKNGVFSSSTAAPTFGRIATFLLDYLQIPPDDL
jgi:cell division protein FtsI (penicillin-binding protein 3)/stage V sporulation protein D (sporulation-specific penicillin-binding protein)